jgi:hypothetical protein
LNTFSRYYKKIINKISIIFAKIALIGYTIINKLILKLSKTRDNSRRGKLKWIMDLIRLPRFLVPTLAEMK